MSKADVIEIEGTVVEKLKRHVPGRAGKRPSGSGTHQRKAPHELYPYSSGR